ncbi:hypothetical protein GCM10007385_35640 [Tateyamaria omphalii]|uniref:hypothetical protein n=1 Tax=Tateyamaria omphalii TaxID=299262 RepID=UPI001674D7DB|nr:hypothetical protein [Tateyamaria omphalii]GGX63375.1 hypothetical protein GCM10007385_35640 [Tateyamaria omphalii]
MMALIAKFLGGNVLDRVLDTVDRKVDAQTDKDRIKGEVVQQYLATRADFMRAGGFWLMLLFAVPLAFWFSAVVLYSVLWCAGCAFPQNWTVAALPAPLDEWAGTIIVSIFGVVAADRILRR